MRAAAQTFSVLLLAAALMAAAPVPAKTLPPRDECAGSRKFAPIARQIRDIVKRRDTQRFSALLAPDVKTDFGGGEGKAEFEAAWHLTRGKGSPLWPRLDAMLKLGCGVEKDWAAFPYLFVRAPQTDDVFSQYLAIGTNIVMRSEPTPNSRKIATLNWDIVTSADRDRTDSSGNHLPWFKVTRADGATGYVSATLLRSAVDYRLVVGWVKGKPMITHFIAGD